ncbi:putative odorant receptor 85d, partial [Musca vetustissima]|uniref:putative odorant receptor 85d n=1 Tax=Musca vetustissima TaxID=27455 RepID=UPI002AB781A6
MVLASDNSLTLFDFIRLPLKFYSAVGIKMFEWNADDSMTITEKCIFVLLGVNFTFCFFAKGLFFVFGEFVDTVHATQWILYFMFAMNGCFKTMSVAIGRKRIYTALKDMERMFPETLKERQEFRLAQNYSYIMRHAKFMGIQHFGAAAMFIAFPVVQSSIEYLRSDDENAEFVPRTPYVMVYPFDASRGIGYVFAYVTQFIGGFSVSCHFVGSDMLLMCATYLVIIQFDYLCYRIENFKSTDYDSDIKELKIILERHNLLNVVAETVNGVFSFSILLNYMISIFIIVMISIQIANGSDLDLNMIKFVGFFVSASSQVYYICMLGQRLIDNSYRVSGSLIGQEWYATDVRYQRLLVLAIARSQRPAHLTAFKFFTISIESYGN